MLRMLLLGFTVVALLLTTLPGSSPVMRRVTQLMESSPLSETVLHGILFAALTLFWYAVSTRRAAHRRALLLAVVVGLIAGTATEVLQAIVPGRGASLSDLGANWLGVCTVGLWLKRRTPPAS